MRCMRWPVCLLAVCVGWSAARNTFAQESFVHDSIEWMTLDAEVVVQGTISDVAYTDILSEKGSATGSGNALVSFKVAKTLKGKAADTVSFTMLQQKGDERLSNWKKSDQPLVWFFKKSNEAADGVPSLAPRNSAYYVLTCIPLATKESPKIIWPVLTADLKVLNEDAPVLAAIAEAAKIDKQTEQVHIPIPIQIIRQLSYGTANDGLTVPAGKVAEGTIRRMIESPQDFDDPQAKMDAAELQSHHEGRMSRGISLLGPFKSDENIALVKTFLSSSAKRRMQRFPDEETDFYLLRAAAYDMLVKWNVQVERPVFEVDVPPAASKPATAN